MRSMLVLLLLNACGEPSMVLPTAPVVEAPAFLQAARAAVPAPFDGAVTQVIAAGGYTYLQVDSSAVESHWVVIIRREVAVGDRLSVKPYGQLADFTSKRTGLTFDRLVFATITQRSI